MEGGAGGLSGFEMEIWTETAVLEPDERFSGCNSTNWFLFCFFNMFFQWPSLSLLRNHGFLIAQGDSSLLMLLLYKFMSPNLQFVSSS